jgi:hypothetical protein
MIGYDKDDFGYDREIYDNSDDNISNSFKYFSIA